MLQCYKADSSLVPVFMKEMEAIADHYPECVTPYLSEIQKLAENGGGNQALVIYQRIRILCTGDHKHKQQSKHKCKVSNNLLISRQILNDHEGNIRIFAAKSILIC